MNTIEAKDQFTVLFLGGKIRLLLDEAGKPWMVLRDIQSALQYAHWKMDRLIQNRPEMFEGMVGMSSAVTALLMEDRSSHRRKRQTAYLLSRDGVLGLLMILQEKRIQDDSKRARVVEFQRWAMKTLGEILDGKVPEAFVPSGMEDLLLINDCHRRAQAVHRAAEAEGLGHNTIYRRLAAARISAGIDPTRLPRSDRGRRLHCDVEGVSFVIGLKATQRVLGIRPSTLRAIADSIRLGAVAPGSVSRSTVDRRIAEDQKAGATI